MKNILYCLIILFFVSTAFFSCKKEPGSGGNSSIKGKISVKECGPKMTGVNNTYNGFDEDIYIIYGDDISYSDRIKTDYEGDFEFKYLRKGSYKIYFYSMDSTQINPNNNNTSWLAVPIVKEISITKKKQVVDAGTISLFKAQ